MSPSTGSCAHEVAGVPAADPGGLHAAVGGQVGGAEAEALHPGRGPADLLDVGHAARRLEDGVDEERAGEAGLGLELGDQTVDVVDVLGALDLGDHDDVELVADLGDGGDEVVEAPGGVEGVDAGPELGVLRVPRLADLDEPGAGGLLVGGRHAVLEVAEQDVDRGRDVGDLRHHLRVRSGEEVDHPRRGERDLPHRLGGADGQGTEEVLGAAHQPSTASVMRRAITLRQRVSSAPSKIDSTRASTK